MKFNHPYIVALVALLVIAGKLFAQQNGVDDLGDTGDEFNPFLFALVMVALLATAICFVICVVIGVLLIVLFLLTTMILASIGIVSSSAVIALLRRRWSAGVRALHYQLFIAAAWPWGIGATFLACWLLDSPLKWREIFLSGSLIGFAVGALLAFAVDWTLSQVFQKVRNLVG